MHNIFHSINYICIIKLTFWAFAFSKVGIITKRYKNMISGAYNSVAKIPKHLFPRSHKQPLSFHCLVNYLRIQCKVQILSFTFSSRRTRTTKNHRHIVLCLYSAYYACTMPIYNYPSLPITALDKCSTKLLKNDITLTS